MNRPRLLLVFGTRPEAIKMAPLIKEIEKSNDFDMKICVTGQHREMLDQVLSFFEIDPDFDLKVMTAGQDLTSTFSKIITGLSDVLASWRADMVLVHGDTVTTSAASLTAFYSKISVAHIEAGLRTGNIDAPWPEEANRKLTAVISKLHFAPTIAAMNNLLNEGIEKSDIYITGNTVIDALLLAKLKLKDKVINFRNRFDHIKFDKKIILITGHRRENIGSGFDEICKAIIDISKLKNVEIVFPVHLNPSVRTTIYSALKGHDNIHLIEPLEYHDFVQMMDLSYLILTDSGGIQEEAPTLGKPVLVLRDVTERPEAIVAGSAKLVGTDRNVIYKTVFSLVNDEHEYKKMSAVKNPYGDGNASIQILNTIKDYFNES